MSSEGYCYDELGQLTSESVDGSAYATWSYDAAGNRKTGSETWTYDDLNQITASPSANYEHDLSGNRTWKNRYVQGSGVRYTWDILNRMLSCSNTQSGAKYTYRADGLRTEKVEGLTLSWTPPATTAGMNQQTASSGYYDSVQSTNLPTTRYYYDGQSSFEEDYTVLGGGVPVTTVRRNALGARGIDAVYTQVGQQPETAGYMLYDGHGNVTATLARNGSSFIVGNERLFDAWGNVRSGSTSGAPRQRYVGNLRHVQDDESGLVYMRARYYEPNTGRFVSFDPARAGSNWYAYCSNNPTNRVDYSGAVDDFYTIAFVAGMIFLGAAMLLSMHPTSPGEIAAAMYSAAAAVVCFGFALSGISYSSPYTDLFPIAAREIGMLVLNTAYMRLINTVLAGLKAGQSAGGLAFGVTMAVAVYSLVIMGALWAIDSAG